MSDDPLLKLLGPKRLTAMDGDAPYKPCCKDADVAEGPPSHVVTIGLETTIEGFVARARILTDRSAAECSPCDSIDYSFRE